MDWRHRLSKSGDSSRFFCDIGVPTKFKFCGPHPRILGAIDTRAQDARKEAAKERGAKWKAAAREMTRRGAGLEHRFSGGPEVQHTCLAIKGGETYDLPLAADDAIGHLLDEWMPLWDAE